MSTSSKQKRDTKKKLAKKENATFAANRDASCCSPSGCSDSSAYVDTGPFGTNS